MTGLRLGRSQVRMFRCARGHRWPVVVKPVEGTITVAREPGAGLCPYCRHLGSIDGSEAAPARPERGGA